MNALTVVRADITTLDVDAIVNAANSRLRPGGGVCGAIHRAAGPQLAHACAAIGGCPTGGAVTTDGFDLPARHVIHAVGPRWAGGHAGEEEALASCYRAILEQADTVAAATVAIPSISTGIYGFPLQPACDIALETLVEALPRHRVTEVFLVAFDDRTATALEASLHTVTPIRRGPTVTDLHREFAADPIHDDWGEDPHDSPAAPVDR
ncbi:MAG: O-acetyl-ADP-ribose deacetylase [Actinomycetota bacterium]|nr:O-acetyl-ADP-ribose deacetylase [Actinomycetota bacterium]